jgi:glycosyltransferase involved in cell wall biosynthesis
MGAKERFQLRIYFAKREWLTHYYDGKEWVRGTTKGRITNLFSSVVKEKEMKFIPLIPLNRLSKSLGYEKASALMLQLARYYAVPLVPLATSENRRRWFIVPCYGLFQFLKEEFGLSIDKIALEAHIDITDLSDEAKRFLLAGLLRSNKWFDKIGDMIFVPYDVIEACLRSEQIEVSKWSLKTVLAKGLKAFLRSRNQIMRVEDASAANSEESSRYQMVKWEISDLPSEVRLMFDDFAYFLDWMERLINDIFFSTSDEMQRAYSRLHADGPEFPEGTPGAWWDAETETIDPLFAVYYEARRRVMCNMFRRAKLTENYIKVYPPYWSPKPDRLLTRALNASYKKLRDKTEEFFRKLKTKEVECVRIAASVLKDKMVHLAIPKSTVDWVAYRLKISEEAVKIFLRWTYEFFGFLGLRLAIYRDSDAARSFREMAWKFDWLENEFAQFHEFFWALVHAAEPQYKLPRSWNTFAVPDY